MSCDVKKITIDGVEYVRADSITQTAFLKVPGARAILILDRGWVVAGDVTTKDGRLHVSRAVHARSWSSIGFDGMIANPKGGNVVIRPIPNGFDVPADAELFRVPVADDWGL